MTTTRADERLEGRYVRQAGLSEVLRVRVPLWVTVLFMALAFGAGIAVSAVSQPGTTAAGTTAGLSTDQTGTILAPPLTDQQIEQGLPAGHPDVAGGSTQGGSGDATGGKGGGATKSASDTKGGGSSGGGTASP